MSYPEYFNTSELRLMKNVHNMFGNDNSHVSKDDWEVIQTSNTIIHASNRSDHVEIDILID